VLADRAHSLRQTEQQSMHHLKEAEIHKSELTGVLEIPIILGIRIFKKCKMSNFWPFRYQNGKDTSRYG